MIYPLFFDAKIFRRDEKWTKTDGVGAQREKKESSYIDHTTQRGKRGFSRGFKGIESRREKKEKKKKEELTIYMYLY
jgi:hypothetical protein